MKPLEKRRVIITGGARGIGRNVASGFVAAGARAACLDLRDNQGEALARELGSEHCRYFHCDVSIKHEVDRAFGAAVNWMGGLDVLVHSAGLDKPGFDPEDIPEEAWDLVMNVNAKGAFLTNQAACRVMKGNGGGAIINFGSFAGIRGMSDRAAYSAAKAAVFGWTRAVAQAWGPYGITVNAIAPTMETEVARKYLDQLSPEDRATADDIRKKTTPIGGRLGNVTEDLLPLMIVLAGPGGRYITGQS